MLGAKSNPNPRATSTPPNGGSSVHRNRTTIKLSVDTSDVDKIAIGIRLYDMFSMRNPCNKIYHDKGKPYMTENDINAMYQLVNQTDESIEVYRV